MTGFFFGAFLIFSAGSKAAIMNDKLLEGKCFGGYEFGHMTINLNGEQCRCGKKGCLEQYTSATGTHIEQNTSVNDVFGLGDQKITWAWTFDPAFDKVDTILGNLIAERANVSGVTNSLAGAANDFDGDVVKLSGPDNQAVSQPVEYTDYCLDTRFDITIKVEQVD